MAQDEEKRTIRCIFCNKELIKEEIVRFRGAISCRDCASSQQSTLPFRARPLYLLAAIGCVIGLLAVEFNMLYDLMYRHIFLSSYTPPLAFYFTALSIAVIFQSIGFYAINQSSNKRVGIIVAALGLLTALVQIFSVMDIVFFGPYLVIDDVTYIKDFLSGLGVNYFSTTHVIYSLFMVVAGLSILVEIGRYRIENIPLVAAALYIVCGFAAASIYIWPPVGPIHILMYAVASVYFFTRKVAPEQQSVTTLEYE